MVTALNAINATGCAASAIPTPYLFGGQVLSIETTVVTNYSYEIPQGTYATNHAFNATGLDFCNVSLYYTHPGYDDYVNVQVWLPLETWNGRFQGTGGGGFVVGLSPTAMAGAVAEGYAVASSDGGHTTTVTEDWVLKSPGNINWPNVLNFGSVALYDLTVIGKAVTTSFYGCAPKYSYFTGCSTGGRQGMMLAQRWPELYDGILAGAPGINYAELVAWLSWPQLMMLWLGEFPQPCETAALTQAAISACDHLDGQSGINTQLSAAAANLALSTWNGARSPNGTFLWYGLNKDAPLSGLANTTCDYAGTGKCSATPFTIATDWIQYFIHKDPEFDFTTVTINDYHRIFHRSIQEYGSPLGTSDPDVRLFGESGGKLLMWQGLADQLVPINGTRQYYDLASAIDPNVADYFRYFEAPGVNHCRSGAGPYPGDILESLVAWVEDDAVPETLNATSLPNSDGVVFERNLCAYPLVQRYKGAGDVQSAMSYECVPLS
ncbi:Tannase/feruloyl esterase [Ilyonectria destructans]|nr:Tannase/feruloyl esterase [Ilyonectria destructans]